jgi:hypothetical protein
MEVPTMIVGIDVVHHVGIDKDSIVGFAASMNGSVSKYYFDMEKKANIKGTRLQDITFALEHLFQSAIIRFKETCNRAPMRFIVY